MKNIKGNSGKAVFMVLGCMVHLAVAGALHAALTLEGGHFLACGSAQRVDTSEHYYKLIAAGGDSLIGTYEANADNTVRSGFVNILQEQLLAHIGSFPHMGLITAHVSENIAQAISNGSYTNCHAPVFCWDVPESTSPVTGYYYTWSRDSAVLASGNTQLTELPVAVADDGMYILLVRALNETGNWGIAASFTYMLDTTGPRLVNIETLSDMWVHPLTVNLSFEFTEELDAGALGENALQLAKSAGDGNFTEVAGTFSYNGGSKTLVFSPGSPLKALSEYRLVFQDITDFAGNAFSGVYGFRTYLGTAMSAEVLSSDGRVRLVVPTWALQTDAIVTLEKVDVLDDTLVKANRKTELRQNTRLTDGGIYRIVVCDLNQQPIEKFDADVTLSFSLPDADNDGVWDGSDVWLKYLTLASLNEEKTDWHIMEGAQASVTRAARSAPDTQVSFPVDAAGRFTLISYLAPTDDVHNVLIYPVPFRPKEGHREMTFLRLPVNTTITIYNIAGERIRELDAPDQGQSLWDVKNSHGEDVASGVYLAMIKSNGSTKVYKLAVQR